MDPEDHHGSGEPPRDQPPAAYDLHGACPIDVLTSLLETGDAIHPATGLSIRAHPAYNAIQNFAWDLTQQLAHLMPTWRLPFPITQVTYTATPSSQPSTLIYYAPTAANLLANTPAEAIRGLRLHPPHATSSTVELDTSRDPITISCELPRDRQRAELVYDYDALTTGHLANDGRLISDINDRPDSDIELLDAFKDSPATIRPGQSRGLHAAIASIEDVDHDIAASGLYRADATIRVIAARLAPTWHHPISDLVDLAHHLAASMGSTPHPQTATPDE